MGPSAGSLLRGCKAFSLEHKHVCAIVDYLRDTADTQKQTVEYAKRFIENVAPFGPETYKIKKLEKVWTKYKASAPYIYALYSDSALECAAFQTVNRTIRWLEKFSSDSQRLEHFLRMAAAVSQLLTQVSIRNVRTDDFEGIRPTILARKPFEQRELQIFDALNMNAEIDEPTYRPKVKPFLRKP